MGGKDNTKSLKGKMPNWSDPTTGAYKRQNSFLQTSPIRSLNGVFASGGMNSEMDKWSDRLGGLYNKAGQPGAAEEYLTGTAKGQYLDSNPYIEDIVSRGASDVASQVGNTFAAGGRYGSVANQKTLGDSVSQYGNQIRNSNYQSERDRMMQAAGGLEAAQNQGIAQQQGIASAGATLGQQAQNNIFSAIGALPTVQGNKLFDANAQGAVGSQIDARTQQNLMDQIKKLGGLDMQNWNAIAGLLGAGQQSAGSYGTQSGTQTSTGPSNPFGMLGGIGSLFGGLGSLFSDQGLKQDIVEAGSENGFPVYEFAYRSDPSRRFRGVMAQDVQKTRPDAVKRVGGWLTVDYGAIGVEMREV